ncbi:SRPBCC family protein [Shimia sp. Alg240-R146]|uniref:SRPBCC family protein n=1 Tax=Shimia sp. Alg240-R146 TaxID=2993449 RepID=UPI0022E209D6|nr:SRPBCC domain-containing protein [Shimia sp. Alg240-R146]
MTDARLERDFPVTPDRLYAAVTNPAEVSRWWGPEGMTLGDHTLEFTKLGPWHSVIQGDEGRTMKMSGQITSLDPPKSVGFTWAWHDENDARGHESHVTFTIVETTDGAKLIIDHRDLQDEDQAQGHSRGWTSTLNCLAALFE